MARMPDAEWAGEHSPRRPMSHYDIVCIHTIVGHAPAHAAHFSTHDTGKIVQSRDTAYRSAANLDGNHRVIAIENEDGARDVPLTDAQIDACARILAWAHKTHGVPLQLCPDSKPGSRGLAYHRQGVDGNFGGYAYPGRVAGGEKWSTAYGKTCPRDKRIAQLPEILRRAKQIVNGTNDTTPTNEEETMSWRENIAFWRITKRGDEPTTMWASQQLNQARGYSEEASRRAQIAIQEARSTKAAVAALAKAMGPTVEKAVQDALKDAVIDVDVTVQKGE